MHGMEFNDGNQVARDCAQGVLAALGVPLADELGRIALEDSWATNIGWVSLQKVGRKRKGLANSRH